MSGVKYKKADNLLYQGKPPNNNFTYRMFGMRQKHGTAVFDYEIIDLFCSQKHI